MEVPRNEDLGAGFPQPGQPGWFPPSFSALPPLPVPSSGSSGSGARELPSSLATLLQPSGCPQPSGCDETGVPMSGARELPSSLAALLQPSGCDEPGVHVCSSFEHRSALNLAKAYAFANPPSRAPAGETKKRHVLRASPKVILAQSKKYAMGALEHYNKRKKIKFELVDVMPINNMAEECTFYTHVNFTARCSKEGSEEQLFFAELQLCSRRKASIGFFVTCCEPLGPRYTVGQRGIKLDGSVVRKNVDFTHCFACSARMLHPKGEKYIAGHCNIPYFYSSPY